MILKRGESCPEENFEKPSGSSRSKEELLLEIETLHQTLEAVKKENTDLEILLEMTTDHAGIIEALLLESNQKLQAEISERQRAEVALKLSQAELQSLLVIITKDKQDLELILETTTEHGDLVENLLHSQSIRDPLTGLFNRRYLEKALEQKLFYAKRHQQCLGLILMDIDNFKHFNNTFGHQAGDIVLEEISLLLQNSIRRTDIPCRYGGEELIVILPATSLEESQHLAEHIRHSAKSLKLKYHDQPLDAITLSLGVASFPEHGQTVDQLVYAADVALHEAKSLGRDCVVSASLHLPHSYS